MKKRFPLILIAVCAAGFAAGVLWLFNVRFEAGDVYPAYSSLRADPLGSMALYESLEAIPGLTVSRDFTSANKLPDVDNTTYLHLAGDVYDWKRLHMETVREIEGFLARGGRLIITFNPVNAKPIIQDRGTDDNDSSKPKKGGKSRSKEKEKSEPDKPEKKEKKTNPDDEYPTNTVSFDKQWGVEFGYDFPRQIPDDTYEPVPVFNKTALPLPGILEWHSSIIFTNLSAAWRTIYARGTNAVVIERKFGHGSIVMASDSWFVSNQALWKDREPKLLAWLVGPGRNIVFDESHFGIMETSGVATLMRKYRLHGLISGLILLAALFIWKNSTSLVPPYAYEKQQGFVAGKDAATGFVNLLRRNIPAKDLLNTCFAEWKKSRPQTSPHAAARMQRVQSVLDAENAKSWRERNPVAAYQSICRILKVTPGPQVTRSESETKKL